MSDRRTVVFLVALAGVLASCSSGTTTLFDFDGDGSLDEDDCAPDDPAVYPDAEDIFADEIDQNCDGADGTDYDGACTATWALDGSYTDTESFSTDFSVTFAGACDDCVNQSWAVTGTR